MRMFRRFVIGFVLLLSVPSTTPVPVEGQQVLAQASERRGQSTTPLPDGTVLILGGVARPAQAAVYDPRTGTSRTVGRLAVPRAWHTATLLPDGTVLVAGGLGTDDQLVAAVERYDPASSSLSDIPGLALTPRAHHTATLLTDGRVLLAGGDTAGGGGAAADVWDPRSQAVDAVPSRGGGGRVDGVAELQPDGRVRITGGRVHDRAGDTVDIFDPQTSTFVPDSSASGDRSRRDEVVAVLPVDQATDVPVDAHVAIRLSAPIDAVSAVATIETTDDRGLTRVPSRVVVAEGGRLIFLTPLAALPTDADVRVTIRAARTLNGRPVARFSSTFRTVSSPTAPEPPTDLNDRPGTRNGLDSPWRKLPPLQAPAGVTALAGQVLHLNGEPLADVTLSIGSRDARTDRTGRFLLRLGSDPSGWQELLIDGTSANRGRRRTYGVFEVAAQIVGRKTAPLPYTIWMPTLDTAHAVRIASPTTKEVVITTPGIPDLELHLPPNTTVTDHHGNLVREISITPIPVDQPPFPLPTGVQVPIYFTIQPGGAYVAVPASGNARKGAWLVYPNYTHRPPGTEHQFWHYDAEEKGWYVYGMGAVAPGGRQVVPNADVALYEFTGAMINDGQSPGPPGGFGPLGSDPVDLSTGQFVMSKTDLVVRDVMPLTLTRTYRTGDSGSRPFGIGATHPYAMFLWSANQYQEADLILPDGKRIHYVRTSSGTGWTDAVFEHTASPTGFYKSTIVWNGNGWDLTLKDGTVYVFGENAPLQSIRDRFGNAVTLTWSSTGATGSGYGKILKVTSSNGRWIAFTYDGSNRITEAKDNIGRTVGYQYDGSGRVWKVTDPRGGVTEYTYDIAHRMLTITDPRGIVYLENQYDVNGRMELQTQADGGEYSFGFTLNGSGQVTQTDLTNPRGYVQRLTFNGEGFLTADTHALGEAEAQTTAYTRATTSNLVQDVTDELGRVTRSTYNALGNVATVTRLYGTADAVTTTYTSDPTYSLVTSVTDPLTHTTTIAYDHQGRIQSSTDALSHQTAFGTNTAGQIVSVTDPLSKVTAFTYAGGDLVTVETPLGSASARLTDAAGRLVSVTDALGGRSRFEYNAHDQLTKVTDPQDGETTFTYDGNGNLLTLTDARGKTTTWTYDDMDRVETRTDPLSRTESFAYDLNGNLTSWTDRTGQVTTYAYDALDRPTFAGFGTTAGPSYANTITTTYDAADRATEIDDSSAGTIERAYDPLDRLTEEVTPEGTVSYTYDAADRRATMTVAGQTAVAYSYDDAGRLTGVTRGTETVTPAYDNADKRTSLTLPNGIVVAYGYDDDSRLTDLTYQLGMSTLGTLSYGYDMIGQRTTIGGTWARTNLPAALTSATYDDANQIATFGGTTFTYDDNGNLTSDGVRSYSWNDRNQLTGLSGGASASFAYDGFGRRRSKAVSGASTSFLYDGWNLVQELTGSTPTANLLTGGIDEFFTRTDGGGTSTLLVDALQSTLAVADASGTVQTQYAFEPFGATTTSGALSTNAAQFTGRENDLTGLSFYRARFYSPRLQRFVSEDPAGEIAGVNLYAYVGNAPTNWIDPFGLQQGPPPLPVPGAGPDTSWRWNPDKGNPRGGTWGPDPKIPGRSQPSGSWDSKNNHWDIDDGLSNRTRVDRTGKRLTPDEAHPRPRNPEPNSTPRPNRPVPKPSLFPWLPWRLPFPFPLFINPCLIDPFLPACNPMLPQKCQA